jgi:aspartyl aminopeptidase
MIKTEKADKAKKAKITKALKEKLFRQPKPIFDQITQIDKVASDQYCSEYMDFLNNNRIETQVIDTFNGELSRAKNTNQLIKIRDNKTMAVAVLGNGDIMDGLRIITSHVDSPRLDLKPSTLYEDSGIAYLKTHYYGGIKKYQWLSRELALVGRVILKNGQKVEINIGTHPSDPVLIIPDLLPHLAYEQMQKTAGEFVPGESLNAVIGTEPHTDEDEEDRVKLAIMNLLNQQYGLVEEDFFSADLHLVPASLARDCGIDRSLIAGYGQDDLVCAYTSFTAVRDLVKPTSTALVIFYDKEEIGSNGRSGAQSNFLELAIMEILDMKGLNTSKYMVHKLLEKSKALSADVTGGLDPNFAEVSEKMNVAKLGYGVAIEKYGGSGGKYDSSEATAEYTAWLRNFLAENKIIWQVGGLGKVDEGGGGTVANYLAIAGADIIDCGPAVLGMHSPVEVTSKYDVWMCNKLFKAFLQS